VEHVQLLKMFMAMEAFLRGKDVLCGYGFEHDATQKVERAGKVWRAWWRQKARAQAK
jgi:hypothetical protein